MDKEAARMVPRRTDETSASYQQRLHLWKSAQIHPLIGYLKDSDRVAPAIQDADYWYEPHFLWPDYHAERLHEYRRAHLHVLQATPIAERRLLFGTRRAALD